MEWHWLIRVSTRPSPPSPTESLPPRVHVDHDIALPDPRFFIINLLHALDVILDQIKGTGWFPLLSNRIMIVAG